MLYDLNHLQGLKMVGDYLEGFHTTWSMVMSELASRPAEDTLQFVYYNHIKRFKLMAADIAHYIRSHCHTGHDTQYLFYI